MTEAMTQAPPAAPPPASLLGISLRQRIAPVPGKAGDITERLQPAAATPIALPAPAELRAPVPAPVAPMPREVETSWDEPAAPAPVPLRRVAVAPAPVFPLPVLTPLPDRHAAEDLLAYWNGLRRGRRLPAAVDLDRAAVAAVWPDSLLLSAAPEAGMAHIVRLGETRDDIEYTPMVTEWILSLGRRAAQRGERLDVADSFPASGGLTRYRLLALPLAAHDGSVEQVLCHLCRADDESARHERRGWFRA